MTDDKGKGLFEHVMGLIPSPLDAMLVLTIGAMLAGALVLGVMYAFGVVSAWLTAVLFGG